MSHVRAWFVMMLLALGALPLLAASPTPPCEIALWARDKVGAVSMTFDDGGAGQASIVAPLLNEHKLRGTFFIVTNWVGGKDKVTWEQLRAMAAAGHEIGSHTLSHGYGEGVVEALRGSRLAIDKEIPAQKCVTIGYPSGAYKREAADEYIAGRMAGKHYFYDHWPVNILKVEDYIVGGGDIGEMRSVVDGCLQQHSWATLTYHMPGKAFAEQLDLLKANEDRLWVAPFGEVARYAREAAAATVTLVAQDAESMRLTLTDTLPDDLYNQPLTLKATVPAAWRNITVTQQGRPVWSRRNGATLLLEAIPDRGEILLAERKIVRHPTAAPGR